MTVAATGQEQTLWRRMRITIGTILLVLASAPSVSADCAWVLWAGALDTENQTKWSPSRPPRVTGWRTRAAYATKALCQQEAFRQEDIDTRGAREVAEYLCLPDTVDPRGPKGK
jgi:hypothetical protein